LGALAVPFSKRLHGYTQKIVSSLWAGCEGASDELTVAAMSARQAVPNSDQLGVNGGFRCRAAPRGDCQADRTAPSLAAHTVSLLELSTMITAANCLLRDTLKGLFFSYDWERMLFLRRNGHVAVRTVSGYYIGERILSFVMIPYCFENLQC
jgi:hypothetical protein